MLSRRTPLKHTALKRAAKPRPTLDELKEIGALQKASSFSSKPRKALKPRSPRNKGGQVALFRRIWDSRPHQCEVCGAHIEEAMASNFSHLLPKGTCPDYKLDERNVVIKCPNCHNMWHQVGPTYLQEDKEWAAVCAKYFALRDEANGLTH
jgi:hypothetical protein